MFKYTSAFSMQFCFFLCEKVLKTKCTNVQILCLKCSVLKSCTVSAEVVAAIVSFEDELSKNGPYGVE